MDELIAEIIADLTIELSMDDDTFSASLLENKVRGAYREVCESRSYPTHYGEDMIEEDMRHFYSTIRSISLYDYNSVGAEYQSNSSENSVTRTWVDRDKLFANVYPIAKRG